jgi:hypothetical protein
MTDLQWFRKLSKRPLGKFFMVIRAWILSNRGLSAFIDEITSRQSEGKLRGRDAYRKGMCRFDPEFELRFVSRFFTALFSMRLNLSASLG